MARTPGLSATCARGWCSRVAIVACLGLTGCMMPGRMACRPQMPAYGATECACAQPDPGSSCQLCNGAMAEGCPGSCEGSANCPSCNSCSGRRCLPPKEPWCSYWPWLDDCDVKKTARRCADQQLKQMPGVSKDFRAGFRQAFTDLAFGRRACLPPVPAEHYWYMYSRHPIGAAAVDDWYAGYEAGLETGPAVGIDQATRIRTHYAPCGCVGNQNPQVIPRKQASSGMGNWGPGWGWGWSTSAKQQPSFTNVGAMQPGQTPNASSACACQSGTQSSGWHGDWNRGR